MRMNQSVDRSIVLPDQYRPLTSNDQKKIRNLRIAIVCLGIAAVGFVIVSIVLVSTAQSISSLKDKKASLQAQNSRLTNINTELFNQSKSKAITNTQLTQRQIFLTNQLNENNQIIDTLKQNIESTCNPVYQRLKLNQTNLNSLSLSTYGTGTSRPIFASLNISSNTITTFNDNILPDLQIIDLHNNPLTKICNNVLSKCQEMKLDSISTLQQFSSNTLTSLLSLNLSGNNITVFSNNILNSAQTLDLSQNKLSYFSDYTMNNLKFLSLLNNNIQEVKGNVFPILQSILIDNNKSSTPNSITNNYFGKITTLTLKNGGLKFKFIDNYFPQLTQLQIFNSIIQDYSTIGSNKMPLLSKLNIQITSIDNYQYLPQCKLLKSILLYVQGLKSISNHNYSNLQTLDVSSKSLITFQNNTLPSLINLTIYYAALSTICKNNVITNKLKYVILKDNNKLDDIQCLKSAEYIEELTLSNHSVWTFQKYLLPYLKRLTIDVGNLGQFSDNYLPMLTYLKLRSDIRTLSFDQFGDLLQEVVINAPIQSYSNNKFLNLRTIQIYAGNVSNLEITNNIFYELYRLEIFYAKTLTLANNTFVRRLDSLFLYQIQNELQFTSNFYETVVLDIVNCKVSNFTNQLMYVDYLILSKVGLQTFQNNSLPMATHITLDYNKLTTVDCSKMPEVRYLDLTSNQLTAQIADRLIGCNLKNLQTLGLQLNLFADNQKQNLRNKLKQKYPKANILI